MFRFNIDLDDPFLQIILLVAAVALLAVAFWPSAENDDEAATTSQHSSLDFLSPEDIREIGARYELKLTGTVGTTFTTIVIVAMLGILVMYASIWIVFTMLYPVGLIRFVSLPFLSFSLWIWLISMALPFFVRIVPKTTGLLMTSLFGGYLHPLGPGLHLVRPWWWNTMDDYIDLRAISVEKKSRFVMKNIQRKLDGSIESKADGRPLFKGAVGVSFLWTVQYGPYLPLLGLYVRTEEKAIADGFEEVVENAISEAISEKPLDEILDKETVDDLQQSLGEAFRGRTSEGVVLRGVLDEMGSTLEERFGIAVELSTLGPPEFDEDYGQLLSAQVLRNTIVAEAKEMSTELQMEGEKALDSIMILNKENVSRNIHVLQADESIKALAPVAMRALREAGEAGRGAQAAAGTRPSPSERSDT